MARATKNDRTSDSEPPQSKRARVDDAESAVSCSSAGAAVNLYSGFTVPENGREVERIDVRDVTPEAFFQRYVATRTPVVLRGFIADETFTAPTKWTNAYLRTTAGAERLKVEERSNVAEKFGRGVEVDMAFSDLLQLIEDRDEMHYLTTQDVEADDNGRPEIMAPFVAKLQGDFPLRPELMGHLVPQNINIWMGNNKDGSSSGLHHDYHDNLYILLRGKKRFRLYSPADAEKMYTRGKLVKVHINGRINYEGEETTAYGADPMSEAAALAAIEKEDAERALALAEEAVENGCEGAEAQLAAAEERLDRAMLKVLRVDGDVPEDEEEPEDGEFGPFHFEDDGDDSDDEAEDNDDDAEDVDDDTESSKKVDKTVRDPVNFSRVDTSLLKAADTKKALLAQFPDFEHAKAAFCEINVGEMLYLPASWFHEVESCGSEGGHLALNYWYHPPDQLDSFETPYSSPFWPRDWKMRISGGGDDVDDFDDSGLGNDGGDDE